MFRYKIYIEYKGTNYVGWQKQKNGISIQFAIESAIKKLTKEYSEVFGAGRTDSGVHALSQVAHFDSKKKINVETIRDGLNNYLRPQPISILKAKKVSIKFHARFSAKQRHYFYRIINRRPPLTVDQDLAWIINKNLNFVKMKKACKFLIGKFDLKAFRSSSCQSKVTIKTIDEVKLKKNKNEIIILVKAKSFLHSQVRIMVGTIVSVGENKIKPSDLRNIIKEGKRKNAGPTAPAGGLYLKKIIY